MPRNRGLKKEFAGVITGASTGMGKALAVMLAKKYNAKLVLNARTESTLNECRALVEKNGGQAITIVGDMADASMPKRLIETCVEKFGDIDVLVNNAGLAKPGPVTKLTTEDWKRVFDVNFFAPLAGTYEALPHFLKKKSGKIVNISSVAGKISFPGSVCYAASKFALTGMSEGMAAELAGQGIDIITVCPGWVRTEFFAKNSVSDLKNPTMIAEQQSLKGLLMRHFLSISSEEAAEDIIAALEKGGPSELILTGPGVVAERINALFPKAVFSLSKRLPMRYVDTSADKH